MAAIHENVNNRKSKACFRQQALLFCALCNGFYSVRYSFYVGKGPRENHEYSSVSCFAFLPNHQAY